MSTKCWPCGGITAHHPHHGAGTPVWCAWYIQMREQGLFQSECADLILAGESARREQAKKTLHKLHEWQQKKKEEEENG